MKALNLHSNLFNAHVAVPQFLHILAFVETVVKMSINAINAELLIMMKRILFFVTLVDTLNMENLIIHYLPKYFRLLSLFTMKKKGKK